MESVPCNQLIFFSVKMNESDEAMTGEIRRRPKKVRHGLVNDGGRSVLISHAAEGANVY